jgi:predicted DNA-binding transcriptional regulator AlpA
MATLWPFRQSFTLRLLSLMQKNNEVQQASTVLPRLLVAQELATAVRKSVKTIYKWAKQGRIPSAINIDGCILFDPEGTRNWIDDHRMAAA